MQSAYMGKLLELAQRDGNLLHILADSGTGYDEMFRRNFPDQIYNFGISEEHMVAAAAGMATVGKIPFVFTAGAFLAYRSLEFIRDDICFQNLNVKIAGMGSGLSWSTLGPTHHTTEDIAVLRALPNLLLLSPATPLQAAEAVELAYRHRGPVYIRLGMNREKEFYGEGCRMSPERNDVLLPGGDLAVFSTGAILAEADEAVRRLRAEGIDAALINAAVLKPFPLAQTLDLIARAKLVVSVEEHNVHGGLGSILAEIIAQNGIPARLLCAGIRDAFATGYGTYEQVRAANGLDAASLYRRIREALS